MALDNKRFFEEIIMYLSILRYIIKSSSKQNLFDLMSDPNIKLNQDLINSSIKSMNLKINGNL